jgi:hypothetical protein
MPSTTSATIHIDGNAFRWRFDPGAQDSELIVRHLGHEHAALAVTLPGWSDPWLCISGFTIMPTTPQTLVLHTSTRNEPAAITPGFVARAIRRTLALGWDPAHSTISVRLMYRDGEFHDFALAEAGHGA